MMAASRSAAAPVAAGVHGLRTGPWRLASNVYLVECGSSRALVDAGWPGPRSPRRHGPGTRP